MFLWLTKFRSRRFRFWITMLLVCSPRPNTARSAPQQSCNEVLNGSFHVAPTRDGVTGNLDERCYDLIPQSNNVYEDMCVIHPDDGLRIHFNTTAPITHVLVNETLVSEGTRVFLRSGSHSVECKRVPGRTVTIEPADKFVPFSCLTDEHPNGSFPDALELQRVRQENLTLTHIEDSGVLGSVMLMHSTYGSSSTRKNCEAPGLYPGQILEPSETRFHPGDSVTIVCSSEIGEPRRVAQLKCLNTGEWLGDHPDCQQQASLRIRCVNGTWTGADSPKCVPAIIKTPPHVERANRSSAYDEQGLMTKVLYTCDPGYYPSTNNATATYNFDTGGWSDVPECYGFLKHVCANYPIIPVVFCICILVAVVIALLSCYLCRCTWRIKCHRPQGDGSTTNRARTPSPPPTYDDEHNAPLIVTVPRHEPHASQLLPNHVL